MGLREDRALGPDTTASTRTSSAAPVATSVLAESSQGQVVASETVWLQLPCSAVSPPCTELVAPEGADGGTPAGGASTVAELTWADPSSAVQRPMVVHLDRPLGGGTYGDCFVVSDNITGLCMCAKFAAQAASGRESSRAALRKEFAVMSRLSHPNILRAWNVCFASDGSVLALLLPLADSSFRQWVEGIPAIVETSVLAEDRVGDAERACLAQIADGIAHMHARAVVHLDLKLENILVDGGGSRPVPLLADFGQSRCQERADGIPDEDLRAGDVNSLQYRPLELCHNENFVVSPRFRYDLWAFGCIMFETIARSHQLWRRKGEHGVLRLFSGIDTYLPLGQVLPMRNYRLKTYLPSSMVLLILQAQPASASRSDQTSAVVMGRALRALRVRGGASSGRILA